MSSVVAKPNKGKPAPVESFRLESHLFYYFTQILARRTRALNIELRPFGLDYSRWRVLAVLNEDPAMSMGRLAELSSVDRTTLTRTLGLMEGEGLVSRAPNLSDRRGVEISLTAQGRRSLREILPRVLAQTRRAVEGFSDEEVAVLRGLLQRMGNNLKG